MLDVPNDVNSLERERPDTRDATNGRQVTIWMADIVFFSSLLTHSLALDLDVDH